MSLQLTPPSTVIRKKNYRGSRYSDFLYFSQICLLFPLTTILFLRFLSTRFLITVISYYRGERCSHNLMCWSKRAKSLAQKRRRRRYVSKGQHMGTCNIHTIWAHRILFTVLNRFVRTHIHMYIHVYAHAPLPLIIILYVSTRLWEFHISDSCSSYCIWVLQVCL